MPPPLWTILFAVVVLWVVFAIVNAFLSRRLLAIDVEGGKIVRAKGKVPQDFYAEVVDVLERARSTGHAEVRIAEGHAKLVTRGEIGDDVAQRLRNVIGRFPLSKLKAGRPVRHKR